MPIPDEPILSERPTGSPTCANCNRHPDEIDEYSKEMTDSGMEPDDYVRREEGTYSQFHNTFWCTECYIKIGMPLGKAGPL